MTKLTGGLALAEHKNEAAISYRCWQTTFGAKAGRLQLRVVLAEPVSCL